MSETAPTAGPQSAPANEFVIWRLTHLEQEFARLDRDGSRGVDLLREQVRRLAEEMGEHEQTHRDQAQATINARRWTVGTTLSALLVFIGPLYVILLGHFQL
jgi:hypothetical protein